MSKPTTFSIGLLLGIIAGAAIVYGSFSQEITDYNRVLSSLDDSETELSNISSLVIQLKNENDEIKENYNSLRSEHSSTQIELQALERENQNLESNLEHTETNWNSLSNCVYNLISEQSTYTNVNESFSRIFTQTELEKISEKIETVSRNEDNNWDGYWYIHKYVRDEIEYVYDSEIPVISSWNYFGEKDSPQISSFQTSIRKNFLQDLSFTIEYEQGDCDDQAMLEYGMIQYYRKHIYGTLFTLYLARLEFENGDGHLAVFMPVTDGQICILDPAGNYQTGSWSNIQSKKAGPELYNYEDHWEAEYGGIKEITLWKIDIDTGYSWEMFKGSLKEAISFFET